MLTPSSQIVNIGIIHLGAAQPSSLASFYQHTLGLELLGEAGESLLLGAGGHPLVGVQPAGLPMFPGRHSGLFHFAFRYPSRLALARALRRLTTLRINLQGASDHGVSESIYLADPEGNGVELYCDKPREEWPRTADGALKMVTHALDIDELMAEDAAYSSRPHIDPQARIGHIHLSVADVNSSEAFYAGVLGFEVTQRYGSSALFFSTGGYHHQIGVNTWQGSDILPAPDGTPGLASFEITGLPLPETRTRLVEAGWTVDELPTGGLITHDPSGVSLVLL